MSGRTVSGHRALQAVFPRDGQIQGSELEGASVAQKYLLPLLVVVCLVVTLLVGGVILSYLESRFVAAAGESLALAAVDIADKLDYQMMERYSDIQMLARSQTLRGGMPRRCRSICNG